ncbi:peptide-N(4)-(N-acetyl-beta-glucosaminyl)asparagine amidase-like [Rhopilema esculentum]|uniref:peptide-N(4)-(N-acetyl-beta- glucosaminyl)asparagine amidase-like n=1 Tax=Rhopilema esculentum TaxID=499914 RepID=UPI0031D5435E|eukprot:gene13524-4406_t
MAAGRENFIEIFDDHSFVEETKKLDNTLLVLDFTAKWCGPCKFIAPFFKQCSEKYRDVIFIKIDVDDCQETTLKYRVTSMPTFLFIYQGKVLETLKGANPEGLETSINKWKKVTENGKEKISAAFGRKYDCFKELLKNPKEAFEVVSDLLCRFANNILKDERNERYRSIRLENKIFLEKLLPFPGAVDCLFQMGFQEQDDKLVMPMESSLDPLRALLCALTDERERMRDAQKPVDSFPPVRSEENPLRTLIPAASNGKEKLFYEKLKSSIDHVFIYESPEMQRYACYKIPIDKLKEEAKSKASAEKGDERDELLLLLLAWFKTEFFSWMDQPKCHNCDIPTKCTGHAPPTEDDRKWGAGVVEEYMCSNCSGRYRFPRYNHPQKLLESRKGRCGEWANCFTACCRAVGFEARYVLDWTDHVWTEVYSEHQKRWLHCDPCENVCDKPLLYESGWGKKLSYVIAFSADEVIDVTWRYSKDHEEVLKRRNEVSEAWLVSLWMNMSKKLQSGNSKERNHILEERRIKELIDFLVRKETTVDENIGRQSGSMAWRLERGETGKTVDPVANNYVFVPTVSELEKGRLRVRYCPASDKYIRGGEADNSNANILQGWKTGVSEYHRMFRKVEQDWNMVYLAREEGTLEGHIAWKFKIEHTSYVFDKIEVKLSSKTFESGSVEMILENDERNEKIPSHDACQYVSTNFRWCTTVRLVVKLSGGNGDVAWQHAQLFRQGADNVNEYPFEVIINFRKK